MRAGTAFVGAGGVDLAGAIEYDRREPTWRATTLASFLTIPAEGSSLSRYLEEIRRFPMLEPEEEFVLAKNWQEHGDVEAAHRLVTSHLRLVAKIAMGYRGYGLPLNEIISEGNVGLMQAVKRFDPDRGFRPRDLRDVHGGSGPRSRNTSCTPGRWSRWAPRRRRRSCSSTCAS